MQDEPERLEVLDRRLDGQGEGEPLGGAAGAERLGLLAPAPARAAAPPRRRTGRSARSAARRPRRRSGAARTAQPGPDVGVGGQQAGRAVGEERGLVAGRDDDRGIGPGRDGGDRRREVRAGDADPERDPGTGHSPGSAPRNAEPARSMRTGSGPHNGPSPSMPTSNWPNAASTGSLAPRQARAEPPERLEGGLGRCPVRVGIGVEEGRLRDEPVGAPQRHARAGRRALARPGSRR